MQINKLVLIPSLALILPLAACDGYEMQITDKYFPYGNERTAGSGVAYVLAKMMPEKEMQLKPVERRMEATPAGDAVIGDMREVFREKQRK